MTRTEWLSRVPLFRELDPRVLSRIADLAEERTFDTGRRVVNMGEPGDTLYVLLEGAVAVLYPARSEEFELARLGPGEFFGEMALLNDSPRSASVQVLEPTRALALRKDAFRRIVQESPELALKLLETLSTRIRLADRSLGALKDEALRDPLTGLLNRRAFHDRLREEVDRFHRYGENFALILLDLDRFKSINDTLGHDVGDQVLRWVGRILLEHTRTADTPFRIGGEEFAILAPSTPGEVAEKVAQRLVLLVAEARPAAESELRVTISAGFAAIPDHADDADVLFQVADQGLLQAKEGGRNRVMAPGV